MRPLIYGLRDVTMGRPKFMPSDLQCCLGRQVARLDRDVGWARALDGTEYMPGLVGLNNMKANDYANVVIQVTPTLILFLTLYRST